jgi:membrane-anchored protein YejM (alkaline phosphatase superfamily)
MATLLSEIRHNPLLWLLVLVFRAWSWMALAQMSAHRDAAKARAYLREIIASRVTGELWEDARRMLDDLGRRSPQ